MDNRKIIILEFNEWLGLQNDSMDKLENIDLAIDRFLICKDSGELQELLKSKGMKPNTTIAFEELCEISLNETTDLWDFYYRGSDTPDKPYFSDKSKFQCKIKQKELQKELGL